MPSPPIEKTARKRASWLLVAIFLVFFSRFLIALFGSDLGGDDGRRYWLTARNLVRHGVWSGEPSEHPHPNAHDVPIYPLFLAGLQSVVPDARVGVRLASVANAIAFTAAAAVVYAIALLLSGSVFVARASLIAFAVVPDSIPYSVFCMPESFCVLLLVGAVYFLLKFCRAQQPRHLLLAFSFWALAFLCKPVALFFGAVLLVVPWSVGGGRAFAGRIAWVACGFALALAVAMPWMLRNYVRLGSFCLTPVIGWNLYHMSDQTMWKEARAAGWIKAEPPLYPAFQIHNPLQAAAVMEWQAVREIASRFPVYVAICFKHLPRTLLGTGTPALLTIFDRREEAQALRVWSGSRLSSSGPFQRRVPRLAIALQLISWAILLSVYLLAACGAFRLWRRYGWSSSAVFLLPILTLFLLIGPWCTTRYRFPLLPFLAVLCGLGVQLARDGVIKMTAVQRSE